MASGRYESEVDASASLDEDKKIALAKTALNLGDVSRARNVLESLLKMGNCRAEVLMLAASAAMQDKAYDQACELMEKVVRSKPKDPHILYNFGTALSVAGKKNQAVSAFQKALEIKPDMQIVYPNLGHTLRDLGRSAEAFECYRKAFRLRGVDLATMSQILLSMHYFSQATHQQLFAMHRQIADDLQKLNPVYPNRRIKPHTTGKIRIAYLSPRFSREIVGYFFKPLFDHHDRERFEIYLYSITSRTDEVTEYFAQGADRWINVGAMSDSEVCQDIVESEIDVLVDLAGHAPENRIGIMARKPAPIQISMLDYFDTTGLKTVDYYITDCFSSPERSKQLFTEQLIYLKQPRLVYEAPIYAPALTVTTSVDRPLVFGSFNRHQKLVPDVIQVWSKLMLAIPGSRLILKGGAFGKDDSQREFVKRFSKHGVEAQRIEFRGASPHVEMFAEYGDIDIALDTFPYNGGLTTCEALWMGTPVLTLLGERIVSRQTAGMLHSIGIPDFIAETEEHFVEIGQSWATRRDELLGLRMKLRGKMATASITDASSYACDFEAQVEQAVQAFNPS
jgi:predicted O-linked N-acetylglucosamine transferase (SPINDLY family)